jgi:hypothetical protein
MDVKYMDDVVSDGKQKAILMSPFAVEKFADFLGKLIALVGNRTTDGVRLERLRLSKQSVIPPGRNVR